MEEWVSKKFMVSFKQDLDNVQYMVEGTNASAAGASVAGASPDEKFSFSNKYSRPSKSLIDSAIYKDCIESKDKIAKFNGWEKWSRLTNPYEKVVKIKGTSNISRAYYKLYEILNYFEIKVENSFHFCEAPGGFIKATIDYKKTLNDSNELNWYAQTLYEDGLVVDKEVDIPEKWLKDYPSENPMGESTGDTSGNLYNFENIVSIVHHLNDKNPVDFITADGGFDTAYDPNNQEQICFQLIFGEILGALMIGASGSNFVCKIFDSCTKPTCQILYTLNKLYNRVILMKPRTSRYSNSEKYIVCLDRKEMSDHDKELIEHLISVYCSFKKDMFCRDLGIVVPEQFSKELYNYNCKIMLLQTKYIKLSLNAPQNSQIYSKILEASQNRLAIEFCEGLSIINTNNSFSDCYHATKNTIESDRKRCDKCLKLFV